LPAGSRRFDPAPSGSLDLVVRVDANDPDWSATLIDRFFRFEELVKCRVAESAGLSWQPEWTGPLGDGRLRLVFVPREVPPERMAGLAAWAHEALSGCESARLAA
jgi:hypothetical protein